MINKQVAFFILGFTLLVGTAVHASTRGAKGVKVVTQTTTPAAVYTGPTTVYQIVLGTGAVTDYVVLLDSANATAATATNQTGSSFRGRFYASSATQNTSVLFDPPLFLPNGLTAINSTAVMTSGITWQPGRVTDQ